MGHTKRASSPDFDCGFRQDKADELQKAFVSKVTREQGDGTAPRGSSAGSFAEGVEGLMFAMEQAPEQVRKLRWC